MLIETAPIPWPPEHDLPPITSADITNFIDEATATAETDGLPALTGPHAPRATVRRHIILSRIICHAPLTQITAIITAAARHTTTLWWLRRDADIVATLLTDVDA